MPTLFLRVVTPAVQQDADDRAAYDVACQWLIREDDGRERASGATDYRGLKDLADPAVDWIRDPANVVVLVPNGFVFTSVAEVPGKSAGQMRRALPFVIEEFIADDIERMHIAVSPAGLERGKPVACSVIDRALITGWVDCFTSMGFVPGFMIPEAELLPADGASMSLLIEGEQVLAKTTHEAALVDRSSLGVVLAGAGAARVVVMGGDLTAEERAQLDPGAVVEVAEVNPGSALTLLAPRWPDQPATNLLQGEFVPRQIRDPNAVRWTSVGILAAAWAGVFLVTLIAQGWWSSIRADQLEAEALGFYRELFPADDTATVKTVRRRLAARLGGAGASGGRGFVEYVADLAAVKSAAVTVVGLNYVEGRSELLADLMLSRYEDLEALKEALAERGVSADVSSAEEVAGGVRARMRLSAG